LTYKQKCNIIVIVRSEWNIGNKIDNKTANRVVKKLDDLCRIHIPREIREKIGMNSLSEGDSMLMEINEYGQIVLTKIDVE